MKNTEKQMIEIDFGKIINSFFSISFIVPLCIILSSYKVCQFYKYLTYSVNAENVIFAIDDARSVCTVSPSNHLKFSHYQGLAQTEIKKFTSSKSHLFGRILFDKNFNNQNDSFVSFLSQQETQNCSAFKRTNNFKKFQTKLESIQAGMVKHVRFL